MPVRNGLFVPSEEPDGFFRGDTTTHPVILCGQDPQVCSGSVRAEKRWTRTPGLLVDHIQFLVADRSNGAVLPVDFHGDARVLKNQRLISVAGLIQARNQDGSRTGNKPVSLIHIIHHKKGRVLLDRFL